MGCSPWNLAVAFRKTLGDSFSLRIEYVFTHSSDLGSLQMHICYASNKQKARENHLFLLQGMTLSKIQ